MTEVLERGNIFFAYRPRVEHDEARGIEDVQRLFVILEPEHHRRYRRLIVGQKRLPSPEEKERFWGFVDRVGDRPEEVRNGLERETYRTRTLGWRLQPEARLAGEGVYGIVRHGDHTHLAYVLELPEEPGDAQEDLGIRPEASYIVTLKNPEVPSQEAVAPDRDVELPQAIREHFGGLRFVAADPPELLDVEGFEFVLIGAGEDVREELGIDLDPKRETADSPDIFRHLKVEPAEHRTEPLTEGTWQ
jgi:hypothetical protein